MKFFFLRNTKLFEEAKILSVFTLPSFTHIEQQGEFYVFQMFNTELCLNDPTSQSKRFYENNIFSLCILNH